ncbi:phage head-tail joining protein [Terricaulis sp.]|uniref:phage head-tail joining protein n=1 Tax=Terricaulis sp. TaxID=2768686 RepID=UPI003783F896
MAALQITELQSLRDALIRARLAGVREVRDQNGETVSYKSDAEMARALANCEALIAQMQSGQPINVIKFNARKGV